MNAHELPSPIDPQLEIYKRFREYSFRSEPITFTAGELIDQLRALEFDFSDPDIPNTLEGARDSVISIPAEEFRGMTVLKAEKILMKHAVHLANILGGKISG